MIEVGKFEEDEYIKLRMVVHIALLVFMTVKQICHVIRNLLM